MDTKYKKGNKLVWVGFLGGVLFRILPLFSTPETFSGLQPIIPVFEILSLVFLGVLVYGLVLVLKSKGRHWAWILLLLPLNAIGIIIIYMLKSKFTPQVINNLNNL